jgi:hypothetical protein
MRYAESNHRPQSLALAVKVILGQVGEVTSPPGQEVMVKVSVNLVHKVIQLPANKLIGI